MSDIGGGPIARAPGMSHLESAVYFFVGSCAYPKGTVADVADAAA